MVRFARPFAVALFVLVMAVTPLSAITSGGVFEIWLPGDEHVTPTRVALHDTTGLVRFISSAHSAPNGVSNPNGDQRTLQVGWIGGCDDPRTTLTFTSGGPGYRLTEQTESHCWLMIGIWRSVTILLWAPVDASTVEFVSAD